MALTAKKITPDEYTGNDISGLSNTPSADGLSATSLKARFDSMVKDVLIPKYNGLIDMLMSGVSGSSGAKQIGYTASARVMKENVFDAVEYAHDRIDTVEDSDALKAEKTYVDSQDLLKVDKVTGKSLLSNTEITRLAGIETGAEVNNMSDGNVADLTDGGDSSLHIHDSRYYTETEADSLLSGKSATSHLHDSRYYTETESDGLLLAKVDKVTGSSLMLDTDKTKLDTVESNANNYSHPATHSADIIVDGTTNKAYTATERDKLSGIAAGAQVNLVTSVAGDTGAVTLDKNDVGLGNVDNTTDANKPVSTAQGTALGLKSNAADVNKVMLDVTINTAWKEGTLTYDSASQTFTLTGHGFSNTTPVEFEANTGVLPAGVVSHDVNTIGGMYYNIINTAANTFQICATVGGATAVATTDDGTAGFRVRNASTVLSETVLNGLNLDADNEYDIFIFLRVCKFTVTTKTLTLKLNGSATIKYFASTAWGASILTVSPNLTSKFGNAVLKINLRRLSSTRLLISGTLKGQQSDDQTTATALTLDFGCYVLADANITSIRVDQLAAANIPIRTGTQVLIIRR